MESINILENAGLEEKEAQVYLALLELGESSVREIAEHSNVKRPTVYTTLGPLEEKGFISRITRRNKVRYIPEHPQKLLAEAEINLNELKQNLPQLESLFSKEKGKPRIVIYEGKDKLDKAYDEFFIVKGEAVIIGSAEYAAKVFPRTLQKSLYASFNKEFSTREIIEKNDEGKKYAERHGGPYREIRLMPSQFKPFEADIAVFGNRTLITSVKNSFFTISIESKELAHAFRSLFEGMWLLSKE